MPVWLDEHGRPLPTRPCPSGVPNAGYAAARAALLSGLVPWQRSSLVREHAAAGHVVSDDQTIALELSQRPEYPGRLRPNEPGQ
jgi:hypothetical protein